LFPSELNKGGEVFFSFTSFSLEHSKKEVDVIIVPSGDYCVVSISFFSLFTDTIAKFAFDFGTWT